MNRKAKIFNVVGARPNMMKMAPIMGEMRRHSDLHPILVHTGQHYDFAMSQVFLEQLKLGMPDFNLQVGSGTDHDQTSEIAKRFGELVAVERPDMIVVAGDVNSTMACAVVGAKASIPVAHVEAGLRSFDRTMPEEVNRIVADSVSELLFTTEPSGAENLLHEGVPCERIYFVGNVMIDSLVHALEAAHHSSIQARLGVQPRRYALLTLHRPSNVDDPDRLGATLNAIGEISRSLPVLFPMHPRTASTVAKMQVPELRVWDGSSPLVAMSIWAMPPAPYIDFVSLMENAAMVITDSGGIQEETTYLGIPCLTCRNNTERPITVTQGANRVIGQNPMKLLHEASRILAEGVPPTPGKRPELWDGHAAERIVRVIRNYLNR